MTMMVDATATGHAAARLPGAGEAEGVVGPDGVRWNLRMKDLSDASGLQRQAIHFYIKEGLLPAGSKSARNMAWYGPVHLERLMLVRRLQHERFLPLKAIKAILDEANESFSAEQRSFIRDVRRHAASLRGPDRVTPIPVEALLASTGVSESDLNELDRLGVAPVVTFEGSAEQGPGGSDGSSSGEPGFTAGASSGETRFIAAEDAWAVELMGELRAIGFTDGAGFGPRDLAIYEEAISTLFEREKELLAERLTRFSPADAAAMVERVLPLAHRFLTRYHEAKIRRFFAAWE